MSGMGGCSWCRVGVGFPYSTQCSAALPHRHFGEGIDTWKHRYQVTEPAWFQEHARRPETTPTKTPDALEAEIVRLRQTLAPDGSGTVSAGVIRDHLRQRSVESLPSRRTIYRILNRQAKEVNSHSVPS